MCVERAFEAVYVRMAKAGGFKPPILKEIIFFRNKGLNNIEIAEEIGVSRNTVHNYIEKMKEMHDSQVAEMMSLVGMMMARHDRRMREMLKELE